MIDNTLYKVLRQLLKLETHYYCKLPISSIDAAFKKSGLSENDVFEAVRALVSAGYMCATDSSGDYVRLTPQAHVTVEEFRRTRLMFWLPTIISITSVLISLVSLISSILC